MTVSIPVKLGPVQETLLIPLLGRAQETQRKRSLLQDRKAVEILSKLDYDFSKWKKARSLIGATLRTRMFDRYVEQFLARHPTGTIVELGCGLNTRFERIDNGQAQWFELDLPDVIALRKRFFADEPRRTMIEASVLEAEWMDRVRETGGPWMFVSEAVLIYLDATDAQRTLVSIANRFPGAHIALDTTSQRMVDNQHRHDAMRFLPRASWFRWALDDPYEMESWGAGLKLRASNTFLDADRELIECLPRMARFTMRIMPFVWRRRIAGYRLNLVVVDRHDGAKESPSST